MERNENIIWSNAAYIELPKITFDLGKTYTVDLYVSKNISKVRRFFSYPREGGNTEDP